MTTILAAQSAEARAKGEALIRTADKLLCESWNERMWSDGNRSTRRRRSTRRSTAAIAGSRSNAPVAKPPATSTWPRCATLGFSEDRSDLRRFRRGAVHQIIHQGPRDFGVMKLHVLEFDAGGGERAGFQRAEGLVQEVDVADVRALVLALGFFQASAGGISIVECGA